jgi:hypothetical protein
MSDPAAAASACDFTSESTRSSSASSSSSTPSATTRIVRGPVAPGSWKSVRLSPKTASLVSLGDVGTSNSTPIAPRLASPGAGGPAAIVIDVERRMRPPGVPSRNGVGTAGPFFFAARNSGTESDDVDAGVAVRTERPRPMSTPAAPVSFTVTATVSFGSSSWTIGSHTTPLGSVSRSAPPIASSTKATRASRWSGSASMFLSDAPGSPNHDGFGSPPGRKTPSAMPSCPRTPRSSAANVIADALC